MSVLEEPTITVDEEDVDEFLCHLYYERKRVSLCGLHDSNDPHAQMHHDNGNKTVGFKMAEGPGEQCPTCHAPICPVCLERWETMFALLRAAKAMRRIS